MEWLTSDKAYRLKEYDKVVIQTYYSSKDRWAYELKVDGKAVSDMYYYHFRRFGKFKLVRWFNRHLLYRHLKKAYKKEGL